VKPDECTHLVVKTLARTEKLLCAMAVAPVVVTEKWVRDSIAAKKLLRGWIPFYFIIRTRFMRFLHVAANKYALVDPVNEKKWGFKLTDALKRAKANKGQLFVGITFYVTNKVPVDKKLLKNVVSAHGGQVSGVSVPLTFKSALNFIDDEFSHSYANKTLQSVR
jgi:hypothetical protein